MSRFLLATMPIPGHVAPIAPVARSLVSRGHEVVWYGSKFHTAGIEATGAEFRPIVSTLDFGDNRYDEHFLGRADHHGLDKLVFDFEHTFVDAVPGYVTDLRAIAREFGPDALVHDPAVAAGWVISEEDGLPNATVNVTVLGIEGRNVPPFGLGGLPADGPVGRVRNKAMYAFVDNVVFGKVNRRYRRLAAEHGWPVQPFRPQAGRYLYLQPSVESFEFPRPDLPANVHFIGPLLPVGPDGFERPGWWADLEGARDRGTPVILVTQGTVATDPTELIEPTLRALQFEDVLVIAAGADPAALGQRPDNARVEPFVPFTEVMPLVDAYVTNGGYGGITIALAAGVPVVSSGTTEDKADVGQRVAYSGVGLNLKTARPTPAKVREAVMQVLDDPRFRRRAGEIRTDFARHDGPTEAAELLERLAETRAPVLRAA